MVTSYSCTFRFLALPRDCSDVCGGNGVYHIFPNTSDAKGYDVWCDIGSDGNIWTEIDSEDQVRTKAYDERDDIYIYIYIYIRLKIKPNSVRIRF